ncbi:MAG: hypothetical protein EA412_00735 [Chitinophagaceae bacterium]|nr:MAG: hypothetical protein EA412_00735 [Chitinophagaceae bacterium]
MILTEKYKLFISDSKIDNYLLSHEHPVGRHKAKVLKRYGFDLSIKNLFIRKIRQLVNEHKVNHVEKNEFGIKFIVDGIIISKKKVKLSLRTVWMVLKNTEIATLITIYPLN